MSNNNDWDYLDLKTPEEAQKKLSYYLKKAREAGSDLTAEAWRDRGWQVLLLQRDNGWVI